MLRPEPNQTIPEEPIRGARAAFPKGNMYWRTGQLAMTPWQLAWITVMQSVEGLTNRQAVDAVRERIDWNDALGLALDDLGLVEGEGGAYLLDRLLQAYQARGWLEGLAAREKQD